MGKKIAGKAAPAYPADADKVDAKPGGFFRGDAHTDGIIIARYLSLFESISGHPLLHSVGSLSCADLGRFIRNCTGESLF